jgi:transcription elongation factor Elf1
MISKEILEKLQCSISNEQHHFVIDPIELSGCKHSICRKCLPIDKNKSSIICKKCGSLNEKDFVNSSESIDVKNLFTEQIPGIFHALEVEMSIMMSNILGIVILSNFIIYKIKHLLTVFKKSI